MGADPSQGLTVVTANTATVAISAATPTFANARRLEPCRRWRFGAAERGGAGGSAGAVATSWGSAGGLDDAGPGIDTATADTGRGRAVSASPPATASRQALENCAASAQRSAGSLAKAREINCVTGCGTSSGSGGGSLRRCADNTPNGVSAWNGGSPARHWCATTPSE